MARTTVDRFAKRLGIPEEALPLLRQALRHRSLADPTGGMPGDDRLADNERLEFLGDSILGMLVAEHLYHSQPGETEGQLTRRRARRVSRPVLAAAAARLGLGGLLEMAPAELATGGRERPSALSDAFEAVLGAIYLVNGLEAARQFVQANLLAPAAPDEVWDYKSHFQELMQGRRRATPTYRIREQLGPAHDRRFVAEALVKGEVYGRGSGRSKKEAEQAAAEAALAAVDTAGRRRRRRG